MKTRNNSIKQNRCPECYSAKIIPNRRKTSNGIMMFEIVCLDCGKITSRLPLSLMDYYSKIETLTLTQLHDLVYKLRYKVYLDSYKWKMKSKSAKERAGYKCQICNSTKELETHHKTYENIYHELDNDLIVLCSKCHGKIHDK